MADYKSTEYTTESAGFPMNDATTHNGVMCKYAQFTGQALSSSDTVSMMIIPEGVRILTDISRCYVSDLESSAALNIGYNAHTALSDGSAVAVDVDAFASAVDCASAAQDIKFTESTTHIASGYVTTGELVITLGLSAGTSVSADTFDMTVYYMKA